MEISTGIALLRSQRGAQAKIAVACKIGRSAVAQWREVPAERVVTIEQVTGIPREQLRPDLYRAPSAA